ncbi:MAG: glycosyltransferase family 2 protein [bacterium]|nr:glycosyltransferase family 2 protein [bacterium]
MKKLSIVLPALNEEEAIAGTIKNCIEAKILLKEASLFDDVDIVVVDDGSTDDTAKIVRSFEGVRLLQHKKNKGYGAALLYGFDSTDSPFLSFLDGDGTCDARELVEISKLLFEKNADMVIGARVHERSEMPVVRRVGNHFFAWLVNFLGNAQITDSASGMRLFTRETLELLRPLPSGLHFTPAMSAKAILDASVKIEEVKIHYAERKGRSKLSVFKDGLRFLNVILSTAVVYRPFKIFGGLGILFGVFGIFSWIFNLVVGYALIVSAIALILTGLLLNEIVFLLQPIRRLRYSHVYEFFKHFRNWSVLGVLSTFMFLVSLFLILSGMFVWVWFFFMGIEILVFAVLFRTLGAIDSVLQFRLKKNESN